MRCRECFRFAVASLLAALLALTGGLMVLMNWNISVFHDERHCMVLDRHPLPHENFVNLLIERDFCTLSCDNSSTLYFSYRVDFPKFLSPCPMEWQPGRMISCYCSGNFCSDWVTGGSKVVVFVVGMLLFALGSFVFLILLITEFVMLMVLLKDRCRDKLKKSRGLLELGDESSDLDKEFDL